MQKQPLFSATLCFFILFVASSVFGQWSSKQWKQGTYNSCKDFWAEKPSNEDFTPLRPATGLGLENQFKLQIPSQEHSLKYIWAIYQDSSIYLNIKRLGMGNGFVCIPKPRAFSHFIGVPKDNIIDRTDKYYNALNGLGLIGLGAVAAGNAIVKPSEVDFLLNLRTGEVNKITDLHMLFILEPYPKLHNAYRMDTETDKLDIILLYIELLNDAIEYGEN
jgi:hypothetical protein